MYILHQESENSSVSDVSSALSTALKVVNDCDFMLKSDTVLNAVKQRLELDDEVFRDLKDNITTKNPSDTRILQVVVEADTPEMAKEIVDALCEIGAENINRAMGFEQVNLYEFGALSAEPCNQTSLLTYALVGGVAAVAVYAVFLFMFLMDDSLKTDEDCQNYLGVSVIGDIPMRMTPPRENTAGITVAIKGNTTAMVTKQSTNIPSNGPSALWLWKARRK